MRRTVFRGRGGPPYIGWAQTIAGVGEDPSRELQKVEAKVFGILGVDIQVKDTSKGQSCFRNFYLYIHYDQQLPCNHCNCSTMGWFDCDPLLMSYTMAD